MTTTEKIEKTAEHITKNVQQAENIVNANTAKIAAEARRLGNKLHADGSSLQDELRMASEHFADGAQKFSEAATAQIRQHPLAAFGIAFAAGMIVTRWLRNSRDPHKHE